MLLKSHPSFLFMIILSIMFTNCTTKTTDSSVAKKKNNVVQVIEVESMELTSAEIVSIDSASGGEAVKMLSSEAVATIDLSLPTGEYVMNAYFHCPGIDSDGFYLVANNEVQRTHTHKHHRWEYGMEFMVIKSDGKNPITVQITSAWEGQPSIEWNMLVDRLEIVEICSAGETIKIWM